MNYEELYEALSASEKMLKDAISEMNKQNKNMAKDMESGDLRDMDKAINNFKKALDNARTSYKEIKDAVGDFDRNEYVKSGQFSKQILEECEANEMDVRELGGNSYEMFPNKVTINTETLDTMVDKKKYSCLRPSALVKKILEDQNKLKNERFNEEKFINELADAYDTVIARSKKMAKNAEVKLSDVYLRLAPTARARKEYSKQAFAFDIARLYASDVRVAKDERTLNLGPGRNNTNAIRFLDQDGVERYCTMISFI